MKNLFLLGSLLIFIIMLFLLSFGMTTAAPIAERGSYATPTPALPWATSTPDPRLKCYIWPAHPDCAVPADPDWLEVKITLTP